MGTEIRLKTCGSVFICVLSKGLSTTQANRDLRKNKKT